MDNKRPYSDIQNNLDNQESKRIKLDLNQINHNKRPYFELEYNDTNNKSKKPKLNEIKLTERGKHFYYTLIKFSKELEKSQLFGNSNGFSEFFKENSHSYYELCNELGNRYYQNFSNWSFEMKLMYMIQNGMEL